MKRLILFFLLSNMTAHGADPSGSWEGAVKLPNAELKIEVTLEHADEWSGSISIPAQGLSDFALSNIEIDGRQVRFQMAGIPGDPAFDGKLSDSGDAISGSFSQATAKLEFSLKRSTTRPVIKATLEQRLERLEAQLEQQRIDFGIPGMAVAIVKGDEVVMSRGFGVSNLEKETPVTEDTIFAIGSSTKAFTATAIGMLVDEEKMTWDDPVTLHLPTFKLAPDSDDAEAEVTVRDLLAHRTGFARMGMIWAAGKTSREEILEAAIKAKPWTRFREEFHYCNVTYLAAGQAAAAASNSDWDSLIAERILTPLGMSDSGTSFEQAQADPHLSSGYSAADPPVLLPMRNIESIAPAGAINSNVIDMAKWLRFQLANGVFEGQRLISEERLKETRSAQISMGAGLDYGLGWMLHSVGGHRLVEHGGNIDGFGAQVGLFPDDGLGFVLLTNVSATPLQSLSNQLIADTLLGEWTEESGDSEGEPDFEAFVGKYDANFGSFQDSEFTVLIKNGKLAVDVPGQMAYELKPPNDEGKWHFAATDAISVSFEREAEADTKGDGAVVAMTMHQAGLNFDLPRKGVQRKAEIDVTEAQKYVGKYGFDDSGSFEVKIQDGRLTMGLPDQLTTSLRPPGDDDKGSWRFRLMAGHAVKFNTSSDGTIESLTLLRDGAEPEDMPRIAGSEASEVPDLPSVEEILALREGAGRGRRFDELESVRITNTIRFVHAGVEGSMTVQLLGPDRFRQDLDLGRFGRESYILNGDRGWLESDFHPSQPLEGKYLAQARLASPAQFHGDWNTHFDRIEVLRTETFKGRPTIVVKLTVDSLPAVIGSIDAETGDLLKAEVRIVAYGMELEVPTVMTFDDYGEDQGVRLARRTTKKDDFSGRAVVELQTFEKNIEIDEALFEISRP